MYTRVQQPNVQENSDLIHGLSQSLFSQRLAFFFYACVIVEEERMLLMQNSWLLDSHWIAAIAVVFVVVVDAAAASILSLTPLLRVHLSVVVENWGSSSTEIVPTTISLPKQHHYYEINVHSRKFMNSPFTHSHLHWCWEKAVCVRSHRMKARIFCQVLKSLSILTYIAEPLCHQLPDRRLNEWCERLKRHPVNVYAVLNVCIFSFWNKEWLPVASIDWPCMWAA